MGLLALPIGLLSLIWCAAAERITRLSLIAAFFCLNGLILFAAGRPGGQKDARALMLPDALLAGATRLAAVLPGLVAARPDAGCLPSARPADGFCPALYGDADARLFAV